METSDDAPLIGILTQKLKKDGVMAKKFPDLSLKPYVSASYIKYIEGSKAKVYLINCQITEEEARNIYHAIDGLVLPGGSSSLKDSDYTRLARLFWNWAREECDINKRYFPIVGICLGFQFLVKQYAKKGCLTITNTKLENATIKFQDNDIQECALFKDITPDMIDIFEHEEVTYHNHKYSLISEHVISKYQNIADNIKILATSVDRKSQVEFVAAIEDVNYPFYGLTWHPEKNEHEEHKKISHTINSINCSRHMANNFIRLCSRNQRGDQSLLIPYKTQMYYTGDVSSSAKDIFVINSAGDTEEVSTNKAVR